MKNIYRKISTALGCWCLILSLGISSAWSQTATPTPGVVVAWGNNSYGQRDIPVELTDSVNQKVIAIAAGFGHNLALKSDGSVVAWGRSDLGQSTVPPDLTGVSAIAAGSNHSLALKSDGTVVAWGYNKYGQTNVPAELGNSATANVIAIAGGAIHSLALKRDGTVVAWGGNDYGQRTVPAGLSDVIAIAAGQHHSLALKSDGTVVAWGGIYSGLSTVPAGLTGVKAIAGGYYHSLALKSDGSVVAWGADNTYGQITVPASLSGVIGIVVSDFHSLALKSDGTVVAWGDNGYGQSTVPTGLINVIQIAPGSWHNLALVHFDTTKPSTPANLSTSGNSGLIPITWNAATDNVGVTGYQLSIDAGAAITLPACTSACSYTWDTSSATVGAHTITLQALDAAGNLSDPATTTVTTVDVSPPSIPSNLSVNGSSGIVLVSWTASTDNVGVTGYQLSIDGGPAIDVGTSLSYSLNTTSLANGSHTLGLTAKDAAGNTSNLANITITVNNNRYIFIGFQGDIKNPPLINIQKSNENVQFKWQLRDPVTGAFISDLDAIQSLSFKQTSCTDFTTDSSGAISAIESDPEEDELGLRYSRKTNQYIFKWENETRPLKVACYTFFVTLKDGQVKYAEFNFKKEGDSKRDGKGDRD